MRDTEGAAKQNPHVACDVEGAGDVAWPRRLGLDRRASPRPYLRGLGFGNGAWLPDPVREPCPPKCCYPDMRRSNPPCEASGTTATIWEHQSGGGPAEDGRLNASELSRSVIENQVLTGRSQNGMGSSSALIGDGGTVTLEDAAAPSASLHWTTG